MALEKEVTAVLPQGSILNLKEHARLLDDLSGVCLTANVPQYMIHKSMKQSGCDAAEIEWVRRYWHHLNTGNAGLCFAGKFSKSIDTKMMAITCVFLRNYVDARIVTLAQLVQDVAQDEFDQPTVLLVPNFFVDMESGKPLAGHQVTLVHDVLMQRLVMGCATILYVSSMDTMAKQYGDHMRAFITEHYQTITP